MLTFFLTGHGQAPLQITPEKIENGGFDLKTHEMSFVHNTPEEFFKGNNHPVILNLCLEKPRSGRS